MIHPIPIVIPVLNCLHLTKQAVASALAQDVPMEVMLLDQGSTDGVREWALSEHRIAHVVCFDRNVGVSRAWNHALRYWFDRKKRDAVLVVNNDIVMRPDTARSLYEDGGGFVTAVSTDSREGIEGNWNISRRNHPDFSLWLMRREVWERIGEFDEAMVNYVSDGDMHLRMHLAGIEAYTIGIPFYHYASGTLKGADREAKVAMQKQADADRAAFERKWGFKMGSPAYYQRFEAPSAPPVTTSHPQMTA